MAGRLTRKTQTVRLLYRLGGARAVLAHTVAALGYREIVVYELPLQPPPELVDTGVDLAFAWLAVEEIDALVAHRPGVPTPTCEARFRRGDRCFVGRQGDRIVSSRWVTVGPTVTSSAGVRCTLPERRAYVHDAFTSPDLRGMRVGPAAATRLAALLADEGCVSALAFVEAGNVWAVRNAERIGYRRVGSLAKLVLGHRSVRVRRSVPFDAHFERSS